MSTTTPEPAQETPAPVDPTAANILPADLQDERLIGQTGVSGAVRVFLSRLRSGDLGALPVAIGLIIIWIIFQSLNPAFLSSRNLVNLTLQSAAIGTIAIGIVLVLLLGEIDLSVGSVSGLAASIVGVSFVKSGWPLVVAILAGLAVGAIIGISYGLIFTRFGVPSFVITLAGLLGFLGLQLKVLGETGSINIPFESSLTQFAQQSFLPDVVAYVLALLVVAAYAVSRLRANSRRAAAGLSVTPVGAIAVRAAFLAVILLVPVFVLNKDRGVSVMFLVFLGLVVIMDFAIRRTRWGRSVMAVGGNVEAARRAGINVRRIYVSVFALCSTFAALGGIFAMARLSSVGQSSGGGDTNLNAIAAAVIGGTSLFGGRGSAYSALLGILVLQSISNGLNLINLQSPELYMITGAVLLLAVTVDAVSRRSRAAHGRA
ncbi:sugar ABC transporter permease [Humibacillus xanthopallidus]|uniref:Xylose transport system permease protein XylH n=1 Tax=Humibacillus xanthopallidus TaxID=412689 RepID=A0A543HG54_9MICO|nr:sugar ABC transporter permease [Humibacillus xanthopallidus]TQM57257.1 D-xylose transport system permease protein [Humibacillus xanthopallidus]